MAYKEVLRVEIQEVIRRYPYPCQPAVSPGPAPSLPMPLEINHDPRN